MSFHFQLKCKYQYKNKLDLTGISSTIENESWDQNENTHSDQFWFYRYIDVLRTRLQDKRLYSQMLVRLKSRDLWT